MEKNKSNFIEKYFDDLGKISRLINQEDLGKIMEIIEESYKKGRTLFLAGNGGSAATASHMTCDLLKTIFENDKAHNKFRVICLNDNIPLITAIANDISFVKVFSKQLTSLSNKGDVLLVITGSGNSKNILDLVKCAKKLDITTLGFLGFDGGRAKKILDVSVVVPTNKYGPVEDFHMIFDHLITAYLRGCINKNNMF